MTIDFDNLDFGSPSSENLLKSPAPYKEQEVIKTVSKESIKTDKMVIRQSNLQHYFKCRRKYKLAIEHPDAIETSMPMRHGLIFERFVLGEKSDHNETDFKTNVYGKIKAESIEYIKAQAEAVKPLFLLGTPYQRMRLETSDYILQGEADFIGEIIFKGESVECIADLKYTSNIFEYWSKKEGKTEFLQSVVYTYLLFKNTGKLLPFIYVIVEDSFENPLVKQIRVDVKESDFEWIEKILDTVANDLWFDSCESPYHCLGYKSFGKCPYLEYCDEGKELICEPSELWFDKLLQDTVYDN